MQSLLQLAVVVVFAAHLLAVNVAIAGPLFCVWLQWRGSRLGDPAARQADILLAACSLVALAAGVLLGAVLLGLLWLSDDAPYFAAVRIVPASRLAFAAGELVFSFVCIAVYYALAVRGPRQRWLGRLLAVATASNLMYHFPVLFAMLSIVSNRPELWEASLDRRLYHSLLVDPEVISRVLHVWLAAIATAGVAVMVLAGRFMSKGPAEGDYPLAARRLSAIGAGCALAASLAQLPVGLWVLLELPAHQAGTLWAGDVALVVLLGAAVALALLLLQQLAGVALGDTDFVHIRRCAGTLAVVVLLMCGAVDRLKRLSTLSTAGIQARRAGDSDVPDSERRAVDSRRRQSGSLLR